jgi:hypothetical protein
MKAQLVEQACELLAWLYPVTDPHLAGEDRRAVRSSPMPGDVR